MDSSVSLNSLNTDIEIYFDNSLLVSLYRNMMIAGSGTGKPSHRLPFLVSTASENPHWKL